MASSAQARFDKLFANRPKPPKPTHDGLSFAEKELLEYQQRQHYAIQQSSDQKSRDDEQLSKEHDLTDANDASVSNAKEFSPTEDSRNARKVTPHQPEDSPEEEPGEIVYLPRGVRSGGKETVKDDVTDEEYNEPASSSTECIGRFCIFSLVVKFPYKYMRDPNSRVSQRFFSRKKVYERNWKMYYMFGPDSMSSKPLILVPFQQVAKLVREIGEAFGVQVGVPPYPFQLSFYNDGTPTPQFSGIINSKDDLIDLQTQVPAASPQHGQLAQNATDVQMRDHSAWCEKVEAVMDVEKKKGGASKRKKQQRRNFAVAESYKQLQRAQRYLGLLPKPSIAQQVYANQSNQNGEVQTSSVALDVKAPAPFLFEDNPIVISIDVESYEMDHSIITEIGVSTLDTTDLINNTIGEQGEGWIKRIRSRHFRIKGRENLKNNRFVHGDPDMFQFGTSEFVALSEAADTVDNCFEHPYSAGFGYDGPPSFDKEATPMKRASTVLDQPNSSINQDEPRNLLLLGHDINSDIAYLSSLGSSIFGTKSSPSTTDSSISRRQRVLSSIRECLDTSILHQALTKNEQPTSLVKVCHELDITPWHAHNAGNDARYTLEAFIKLAIKARQQQDAASGLTKEPDTVEAGVMAHEKDTVPFLASDDVHPDGSWVTEATDPIFGKNTDATSDRGTEQAREFNSDDEYPY